MNTGGEAVFHHKKRCFQAPGAAPGARKPRGATYSAAMFISNGRLSSLAWLAIALLLGSASIHAQQPPPRLQPDSGPWQSGAGFDFDLGAKKLKKARQSVSGIACNLTAQGKRICLVAFDEGTEARHAEVGDQALTVDAGRVVLRTGGGELDAEGAATDGRHVYITGSHSAKRSDCAANPGSRHVLRLRLDPATGRAVRTPGGALADVADSGRLWQIMQAQPGLAPHVGERKCLGSAPPEEAPRLAGQQGVNIEGLAVRDGRLYFGFRGPVLNGVALVLSVDADALFASNAGSSARPALARLALGSGRGIRDMVAVRNGFLLLAGPDDTPANQNAGWVVAWWDGQGTAEGGVVQPRFLATLDLSRVTLRKCDKELKPEAMAVLEETPAAYQLLVLSDGMCDGGPLAFTVAH